MPNVKQVIVVRTDLNMRKGKLASQVAHAAMKFLLDANDSSRNDILNIELTTFESDWLVSGDIKVVGIKSQDALLDLILRAQLEGVEVQPNVDNSVELDGVNILTCAAFGPHDSDTLDKITGHLKLL